MVCKFLAYYKEGNIISLICEPTKIDIRAKRIDDEYYANVCIISYNGKEVCIDSRLLEKMVYEFYKAIDRWG